MPHGSAPCKPKSACPVVASHCRAGPWDAFIPVARFVTNQLLIYKGVVRLIHHHNVLLVVLSIVIACLAGFTSLHLASHDSGGRGRFLWTLGSAVAMGFGIWSMHFIAMLALILPVEIRYEIETVLISLAIPVAASYVGMSGAAKMMTSVWDIGSRSLIMGFAIAGMHYTGMAAIRGPVDVSYDTALVVLSVLIAIGASLASLLLFRRFRFRPGTHAAALKAAAGVVMGFAISGMHYTAMAAAQFNSAPEVLPTGATISTDGLVLPLLITIISVFALSLAAVVVDRIIQSSRKNRETADKLRLMIGGVKDHALYTLAGDGTISSWNEGAERLTGYKASDIVGKPVRELYAPGERTAAAFELQKATEGGSATGSGLFIRIDGSTFMAERTVTAVQDIERSTNGFIVIVQDITAKIQAERELRRKEEQLAHSQKMEAVGLLAGGVAHDFNNVLGAVWANADLLLADAPRNSEMAEGLNEIIRAADRATGLTRQLLAFSKRQILQASTVNPNEVIRGMQDMLERLLVGDLVLTTDLSEDVGCINVDPAQLEQVILNLVMNARDAMPEGGEVCIATLNMFVDGDAPLAASPMADGWYSVIRVTDEGEGIPIDLKERIFEPFFTTKALGKGTGLGLATVYGIVNQSGGHIWFESAEKGGTSFWVCMPRDQRQSNIAPQIEEESAPRGNATILLVDDEIPLRKALSAALTRNGYRVLSAANGPDAIAIAERFPGSIDMLLCDVRMPGMNGPEVHRRIASRRPTMRILFMSGYSDGEFDSPTNGKAGPNFIQKPFPVNALLKRISELMNAP